jgi:flagellar biosynthetic protein FliR
MVLAVILVPNIDIPDSQLIGTATGVMIIVKEISIGLAAGLIMTIWFSAAALAGEKIASTAGLGFAAQMDPASGAQTPVVSQILNLLLVVLFLSLDAHLLVISIMLKSYEISPIAYSPDLSVLVASGIEAAGMMFFAAAIIMLPVITLLLMINLTIGVVTRSAPTLNLFSFGFPISMLGVFFILYISTDVLGYAFSDLIEAAVDSIERSIAGIAYG